MLYFQTNEMQEKITSNYGKVSNQQMVKPQGIYLQDVSQQKIFNASQILEERIRKRSGQRIVVGVGNTTSLKGFDYFLEMSRLAPAEILFVWAGKKESFYDTCIAKTNPLKILYILEN